MCKEFISSSIGKKIIVAVTGLLFFGFVVAHMIGNLQIFMGQEQLNWYAHKLQSAPFLLWPARVFLLIVLFVHIGTSIALAIQNKKARPVAYASQATVRASLASRTMVVGGSVIFFFILFHLAHLTFGWVNPQIFALTDAQGRHDVYSISILSFQNYIISGIYVFAMFFLCFHLSHGLASFPQTLGWASDEKCRCRLKILARLIAIVIFIGNSSIPLSAIFGFLKLPAGS